MSKVAFDQVEGRSFVFQGVMRESFDLSKARGSEAAPGGTVFTYQRR